MCDLTKLPRNDRRKRQQFESQHLEVAKFDLHLQQPGMLMALNCCPLGGFISSLGRDGLLVNRAQTGTVFSMLISYFRHKSTFNLYSNQDFDVSLSLTYYIFIYYTCYNINMYIL